MVDSGAGLLAVMDLETGTRALIGDNATSSSHVGRTATTLPSVDAVARLFKKGGWWAGCMVGAWGLWLNSVACYHSLLFQAKRIWLLLFTFITLHTQI